MSKSDPVISAPWLNIYLSLQRACLDVGFGGFFFVPDGFFFNLSFVAIMSTLWSVVFCVRCDCSRDFFSFSLEHKSKKIRKKKIRRIVEPDFFVVTTLPVTFFW